MNGQRLRPLGMGDIFDEGFDLYKRNFVFFLLVTALTVVPLDILLAFATPHLLTTVFDWFGITANSDSSGIWFTVALVKLTLYLPLFLLAVAPLAGATAGRYLERDLTLWQVYQPFFKRLPGLLVLVILTGAALDLGLLFCGICWVIPAVQLFFALHAFVIERKKPGAALRRATILGGGYAGRIFNSLLLLATIGWVLSLGVSFPLSYVIGSALHLAPGAQSFYGGLTGTGQSSEEQVIELLSSGLTHLVLIPFVVSVMTVLYYDIRIRKEGFDIELLATELHYPPLDALGPFLPPVAAYIPPRPTRPQKMPKQTVRKPPR